LTAKVTIFSCKNNFFFHSQKSFALFPAHNTVRTARLSKIKGSGDPQTRTPDTDVKSNADNLTAEEAIIVPFAALCQKT